MENSRAIIEELEGYSLKYTVGAEISCTFMGKTYHMTAYSFDANDSSLIELLKENPSVWDEANASMIRALEAGNPSVDYSEYEVTSMRRTGEAANP